MIGQKMFRFADDSIAEYDMQLYVLQLEGVEIRQYEYECQLLATITNFEVYGCIRQPQKRTLSWSLLVHINLYKSNYWWWYLQPDMIQGSWSWNTHQR